MREFYCRNSQSHAH